MLDGIKVNSPANQPYLTTGYRLYMIGGQNGLFPEHGEHMPYEMWGVWAPPVKVLNGFWFLINGETVQDAKTFEILPYGARFMFEKEKEWCLERFQFVPQEESGFVVQLKLKNLSDEAKNFSLHMGVQSNLMPVWLSERAGITDGRDEARFDETEQKLVFKDAGNPWTAMLVSSESMKQVPEAKLPVLQRKNENAAYAEVSSRFVLEPGEEKIVDYYVSFSMNSEQEAEEIAHKLKTHRAELLQEKIQIYEKIDQTAVLSYPGQPVFEKMYRWSKYINDWIIRDVKGVGTGVAAGYAEFPWWFGNDTNYIAPGLLMQGDYESPKSTLRLLKDKSEQVNGNGRVVHEISSNGVVYYEGMTTETPQFADTVWMIYQWSGDREFLVEMYDFCVKGMQWIDSICVDGLPGGYGISEIAGLDCYCCDTALLAIRGYEILSLMSKELGRTEEAGEYKKKQEDMWELFRKEFYLPEYGVYGDMAATKEQIIPRADTWKYTLNSFPITEEEKIMGESSCKHDKSPEDADAKQKLYERMEGVIRAAEQMKEGSRAAFYLFGFGHSMIPLELGYLEGTAGERIFDALKEADKKDFKVENMMPIGIGREIKGLGTIQRLDAIIEDIGKVAEGFSAVMPGATNEIYPKKGCFVQAWNSLATMWPYADSIFGLRPDAAHRKLVLKPCVGKEVDGISLLDVPVGGELFSFRYRIEDGVDIVLVKKPSVEWEVSLDEKIEGVRLVVEV